MKMIVLIMRLSYRLRLTTQCGDCTMLTKFISVINRYSKKPLIVGKIAKRKKRKTFMNSCLLK